MCWKIIKSDMERWILYLVLLVALFVLELLYFKIANHFNIIDKPNLRSSHTRAVLRGGGVIFTIALWIWCIIYGFQYPWMLAGVTLVAGVSFVDDIHSLPDSLRLVVQFVSMFMVFQEIGILQWHFWWLVPMALIVAVGGTNIFNFMDGINGITGGYSIAVIIPLLVKNEELKVKSGAGFIDETMLIVIGLSVLVFCFFNFRKKAKCFAGDVGSIGIALILAFCIGRLMYVTGDITWIVLYLIYGVDGVMTILHRIILHENIGQAHRKHAYQLMANELKMNHVTVSLIYMVLQLVVSLIMIYLEPDTIIAHWIYLMTVTAIAAGAYVVFMMKYYHLHEEYLKGVTQSKD